MKISIIYPSRNRYDQCKNTLEDWFFKTNLAYGIQWIISVDEDDPQVERYKSMALLGPRMSVVTILVNKNKSVVEAINNAAKITIGNIFLVMSDDFSCEPRWDIKLRDELEGKSDFCIKTDDGLQPTLITMPIMDRIYYERYGYVYHPEYWHMFADQELTAVAKMTGKFINVPLKFEHLHYSTGKSQKDVVNIRNDQTWRQGEKVFNEHLKTNFGITEPVMKYEDIKWR